MGKKTIKLADGIRVHMRDEDIDVPFFPDLWKLFNWDIDNDPNAKECADIIVRELFCVGHIDLTKMNNGKLLVLSLIPPKDEDDADNSAKGENE